MKQETSKRPSNPYPFDRILVQQYELFNRLLTDEIRAKVEERITKEGRPWISPDYYFPIFNLGMARINATTPNFIVEQCLLAENSNDRIVAPSIAMNLMMEYENKLKALRIIQRAKTGAPDLVDVDSKDLEEAERAFQEFMQSSGVTDLQAVGNPVEQREQLRFIVAKARAELLPKIHKAARPVLDAGQYVLDVTFDLMGIVTDEEQLPSVNQLPPPQGEK